MQDNPDLLELEGQNSRLLRRKEFEQSLTETISFSPNVMAEIASVENETHKYLITGIRYDSIWGRGQLESHYCGETVNLVTLEAKPCSLPLAFEVGQDFFSLSKEELCTKVMSILYEMDVIHKELDAQKLRNFVHLVLNGYKNKAYHNVFHGFSVFQMGCIFLYCNLNLLRSLGKTQSLAFLLSCLCHDIGHRGYSNKLEFSLDSPLAKIFAGAHLEKFHTASTLSILENVQDKADVFSYLPCKDQMKIRQVITQLILATNISRHKDHVSFLRNLPSIEVILKNENRDADKICLLKAIIAACDISAQCLDIQVSLKWERRLAYEFKNECELLSDLNKVSEIPRFLRSFGENKEPRIAMERVLGHKMQFTGKYFKFLPTKHQALNQCNFLEGFVLPMWREVSRLCPKMRHLYFNANLNHSFYLMLVEGRYDLAKEFMRKTRRKDLLKKRVFGELFRSGKIKERNDSMLTRMKNRYQSA